MKRQTLLLSVIAGLLLVVLFWLLLMQPKRVEVEEVREEIAQQQQQQAQLRSELQRLRQTREEAPEVEAALVAAETVVPRDPALPSALRQLQMAADESGVTLQSVSTSRPTQVSGATDGLSVITVNIQMAGGYFQLVDFLRRTEDPHITPRGMLWTAVNLGRETYPTLNVSLAGELYTALPVAPPPVEEPADETAGDDADLEIEIEVEDEG